MHRTSVSQDGFLVSVSKLLDIIRSNFDKSGKDVCGHHSRPKVRVVSGWHVLADDVSKVTWMGIFLIQREDVEPRPKALGYVQPINLPVKWEKKYTLQTKGGQKWFDFKINLRRIKFQIESREVQLMAQIKAGKVNVGAIQLMERLLG